MSNRNAQVLARHVEGLEELQELRGAMDATTEDFPRRFAAVFAAAVQFYRVEETIRALLLTDHELNQAHRRLSAATGLGPQLPVMEVGEWLEGRRHAGDLGADLDTTVGAMMVCGTANYAATLDLTVAEPMAEAAYGSAARLVSGLLAALGARDLTGALAVD